MRRFLRDAAASLDGLIGSFGRAWRSFFFATADPTPLGLIRVAVGLLLLWSLAVGGLDLSANLGSDGWAGPEAVREYLRHRSPWAWSFWFSVPDRLVPAVWGACLVVLALFTIGLGSRVTAVLAWAIAVATARRTPMMLFGFDHVVSTWALYLAASGASGRAVSLDRWLDRRRGAAPGPPRPTVSANLGLRMIQLHLALIYGAAGLAKLRGDVWWDGTAMDLLIVSPEFRRFDLVWLAGYTTALSLATHGALALEISYPVLIWVRALRPPLIGAVALMHLGIDLTLGLTEFSLAMLAGNLAFVSGPWLRSLADGGEAAGSGGQGTVPAP